MGEPKKELIGQNAEQTADKTDKYSFIQTRCYKCGQTFILREAYHDKCLECPGCHVKYYLVLP